MIAWAAELVPCTGVDDCTFDQFLELLKLVFNYLLGLSVSVAAIAIVVAGIMLVVYPTNEGKRGDAKAIFGLAVKGLVVVLAAWLIVTTITNFLEVKDLDTSTLPGASQ